jgi:alkyl hydroperoxide reductase subunit AhpC
MIAFQREYGPRGVQLVAINSNDPVSYPEDSYEEMVKRAKTRGFNFPYLWDKDQSVAHAYGATHTPEFFVFDKERRLRYHGRFDDNRDQPDQVRERYVQDAVEALLAGREVAQPETYSIGCTIKWKR